MKKILIKMLPMVAAVLLATSCGKDDNNDNSVVNNPDSPEIVTPDNNGATTIPFSITVVNDAQSLSKATVQDETSLVQVFEEGDVLEVTNSGALVGTLSLKKGDEGKHTGATFTTDNFNIEGLVSGSTELSVTLKNENNGNNGELITDVKSDATTLTEAFKKYGRWTSSFTYTEGTTPSIPLKQNTAFIEVLLPESMFGATITIKKDETVLSGWNGESINARRTVLAVPDGVTVESSLFDEPKEISVEPIEGNEPKIVYTIDRIATTEFVDFGLPSGTLWAKCNVGASEPYEYGNYYAWGEVETKTMYDMSNYKFGRAKQGDETHSMYYKYCPESETDYWAGEGATPDGKTTLEPADDIAYLTYGGKYSIPTQEQWTELQTYCNFRKVRDYEGHSGVNGYLITSKTDESRSIFLPTAGGYFSTGSVGYTGTYGFYHSSSLYNASNSYRFNFSPDEYIIKVDGWGRNNGYPVRAVRHK